MEVFWPRRERLEVELQALSDNGYDYEILEGDPAEGCELKLRIPFHLEDGSHTPLEVHFPELYPYFRFQIDAPELDLKHHQHPFAHNLCVLGRPTDQWRLNDTLCAFLRDRVLVAIAAGSEERREGLEGVEEQQAEPFSEYYPYSEGTMLLVDGAWKLPEEVSQGWLLLGFRVAKRDKSTLFPAVVLEVQDDERAVLAAADPLLAKYYRSQEITRWIRRNEPIRIEDPERFFRAAAEDCPQVGKQAPVGFSGGSFRLAAVVFDDEHQWRELGSGLSWVGAIRLQLHPAKTRRRRVTASTVPESQHDFVRMSRAGRQDLQERIPELRHMSEQDIAVFGLGCLGAPAAIEFAKMCTGALKLVDHDHVDPAASVRWPLGFAVSGQPKAEALASFIRANFPFTTVEGYQYRMGAVRNDRTSSELERLEEITADATLIFDATAEHGVQRFLSAQARSLGIPYVWLSGTLGGWGGFVGRCSADPSDACWACVETARGRGEISAPPADPDGSIQAAGCGDPTFRAASFDMQCISVSAVRLAVSTLGKEPGDYPSMSWNAEVISLRDKDGHIITPQWETFLVERLDDCPNPGCRSAAH